MDNGTNGLSRNILRGGAALTVSRLASRTFDLIRMLTIARWLGPQEMGVYAVATLALSALEQLSDPGLRHALIQRKGDITPYKLPVRTVHVVRGVILGVIVFIASPWIAAFFDSPKSLTILRTVAIIPVIRGLEPLCFTLAQKELRFLPYVILQTVASIVGLAAGLIAALIRPDAWALVLSSISVVLVMTVGAHLLSDRQDLGFSFDWRSLDEIRRFGFWIFVNSIVAYVFMKGGDWMIGRLLDVTSLALYQMAFLICTVATMEMGVMASQLFFPVFSHLQDDRVRLQAAFCQSLAIVSIFMLAIAGLICACSPDFYRLVLGGRWLSALPLVLPLTVSGVCSMFANIFAGLFQALGRPKLWTQIVLSAFSLLVVGIFPVTHWFGALGVAILMAIIGLLMQLVSYVFIGRLLGLSFPKVTRHVITPSLACVVSLVITTLIGRLIPMSNPLTSLTVSAISLLCTYALCIRLGSRWMDPSPRELVQCLAGLLKLSPRNKSYLRQKGPFLAILEAVRPLKKFFITVLQLIF